MTSYIDRIAIKIHRAAEPAADPLEDITLYRIYAVLMLAKGDTVTNEDVHNAWSAWASEFDPGHRSLVPYSDLPQFVQLMDTPYTGAIHRVARSLA